MLDVSFYQLMTYFQGTWVDIVAIFFRSAVQNKSLPEVQTFKTLNG